MKDVNEFVKTCVDITYIEDSECYGHYPFQLFVEKSDDKIEMCALALGGNVLQCYSKFKEYKKSSAKRIFMSLDFPSGGDIKNDFVAVFSLIDNKIGIFAIPYNPDNGKIHKRIDISDHLIGILDQFITIIS